MTVRRLAIVAIALAVVNAILLTFLLTRPAQGGDCYEIPVTAYSPTGIAGCVVYGDGTASWYAGPGVARNDCVWPWTSCTPIRISSHDTGLSIIVTPTMYCDCYVGTEDERIVDLDPGALAALGLDPSLGLFRVHVEPYALLPNTAYSGSR